MRSLSRIRPKVGIVLGSGLSGFGENTDCRCSIPFKEIPCHPVITVEGHVGNLRLGKIGDVSVAIFEGRIHYYESGSLEDTLYQIALARELGVRTLVITNAAGGINPSFIPGDLMLITDHINFTYRIINQRRSIRIRHKQYYDTGLLNLAISVAKNEGIPLRKGVYCGVQGPSYETNAEVKMLRSLAVDAVGMSTVNEVTYAKYLGMRVLGLSRIANLSSDLSGRPLSHSEVIDAGSVNNRSILRLMKAFLKAGQKMNKL